MAKKSKTRGFVEQHDEAIQHVEDSFAKWWKELTIFVGRTIRHAMGG